MRLLILLLSVGIFLVSCDSSTQKYNISDDFLERKLFENELLKRNIQFKVDVEGFYTAADGKFSEMVSIGKSIAGLSSVSYTINNSCSSKKFIEWLQSKQVVFVKETSNGSMSLRMRNTDSVSVQALNNYAGFHSECVRSGSEDEYNEIWKKSP